MLKALYFSGTKEDVEKYLRHLTDGRRVTVTHFEDEMTEDERMIAEDKRDSDFYDLRTCHE